MPYPQGARYKRHIDNTEIVGYRHELRLGTHATRELFTRNPRRHHGKQIKYYHPREVRDGPENPLYHPKIGVLFHTRLGQEAVPWDELEDLTTEFKETLINLLDWSDIPIEPDGIFP